MIYSGSDCDFFSVLDPAPIIFNMLENFKKMPYNHSKRRNNQLIYLSKEHFTVYSIQLMQNICLDPYLKQIPPPRIQKKVPNPTGSGLTTFKGGGGPDLDMKRFRDARLKEETSGHPVSLLEATLRQLRLRKIRKTCMFLINVFYSRAL